MDGAGNNNTIDFDTVKFNEPVTRSLVIKNTGEVSPRILERIEKPPLI